MAEPGATPPWPRTWRVHDALDRSSPYSYDCGGCGSCCRDKLIQVNPYEVALLAAQLGLTTTECITQHLDGIYLRRKPDGRCTFFNEQGCSVHPARPLVCRLYPLGRAVDAVGTESFRHLLPHPQTQGRYGETATVQDWITAQGAQALIDAVLRTEGVDVTGLALDQRASHHMAILKQRFGLTDAAA
nr:YkgJ family cysteine cluster protein [Rhodoferax sp.]